jgi:hypothetical protein
VAFADRLDRRLAGTEPDLVKVTPQRRDRNGMGGPGPRSVVLGDDLRIFGRGRRDTTLRSEVEAAPAVLFSVPTF